jgi:uncharacterized protein (TIGR02246 family)
MSSSQESREDRDKANVAAVRQDWINAVKKGDADRLSDLVTYDAVFIHADGRCTRGKDDVRRFLLDFFDQYSMEGTVLSSEVVIHGFWAVEIDEIKTSRARYDSPVAVNANFRAVFVFSRQLDQSWKVARLIELQD